jgi:HPt (histidine-containing phosphotransfer) domain-containing protein
MLIENADYSNINFDEMAASIGLKPKHIPMLIGSFLEESVTILSNLEIAISSNDYTAIKIHAHSIKGSAGNLKFNEIYEMAKEMELSATDSNSSFDYSAYFEAIKSAVSTVPN